MTNQVDVIANHLKQALVFFDRASEIPHGVDFLAAYRTLFDDSVAVENMAAALDVVDVGRKSLCNLTANTKGDLFDGLVGLAQQLEECGRKVVASLEALPAVLHEPSTSEAEKVNMLKTRLAGPDGAALSGNTARDLATKLAEQCAVLAQQLQPALETISTSVLYHLASQARYRIEAGLPELEGRMASAEKDLDGWFRRDEKRRHYEELKAEYAAKTAELKAFRGVVAAFQGLDDAADRVPTSLGGIGAALNKIATQIVQMRETLMSVCTVARPAQLLDETWLNSALGMPAIIDEWRTIAMQAASFPSSL